MSAMRETIRQGPLVLLALLGTLILLSAACRDKAIALHTGQPPDETAGLDEVIATIGGQSFTRGRLAERLLTDYGAEALRSLMLAEAVRLEAAERRIDVPDAELELELERMKTGYDSDEQYYETMREQLGMSPDEIRMETEYRLLLEKLSIADVDVSETEIDRYVEEHRAELGPLKQYKLAQIVVETAADAEDVLARLAEGDDFAAMAERLSIDDFSAEEGGNLGWIEATDPFVAPETLEAAGQMEVGDTAGPVLTNAGYAVIRLDGVREDRLRSEESIRAEARKLVALGKAPASADVERGLLEKYDAQVLDPALQQP